MLPGERAEPDGPDQHADQDEADDRADPDPRERRDDDPRRAEDHEGVAVSRTCVNPASIRRLPVALVTERTRGRVTPWRQNSI